MSDETIYRTAHFVAVPVSSGKYLILHRAPGSDEIDRDAMVVGKTYESDAVWSVIDAMEIGHRVGRVDAARRLVAAAAKVRDEYVISAVETRVTVREPA